MVFSIKKKELVWINIDLPTKKFIVHHHCQYTENKKETSYKGVGELKRDGGWIQMKSMKAAEYLFEECYSHFIFGSHC